MVVWDFFSLRIYMKPLKSWVFFNFYLYFLLEYAVKCICSVGGSQIKEYHAC